MVQEAAELLRFFDILGILNPVAVSLSILFLSQFPHSSLSDAANDPLTLHLDKITAKIVVSDCFRDISSVDMPHDLFKHCGVFEVGSSENVEC